VIRYLAISTVIVFGAAIAIAAWANRDLIRIRIASAYARVAPKAGTLQHLTSQAAAGLSGDAPWALSALPECLTQVSEANGTLAYVRAHLPPGAVPVVPPKRLVYGDCTLLVEADQAFVRRGADRFRIPPVVRFYRSATLLAMFRRSSEGIELRVYQAAQR
jgi:hypothetical protein